MDKKPSSHHRSSSQTPTKGFGSAESKKGQDVNKALPRYGGKRREPTGPFSTKSEPAKKSSSQRNRFTNDKRPRPRGRYYGGNGTGGTEEAGLTLRDEFGSDGPQELESVYTHGSKKKNISHLLNFSYGLQHDINDRNQNYRVVSNSSQGVSKRRSQHCYKHKYSKEEFLQATCQFVVNSNGNYDIHMKNPDALVDWDLIEEVHVLDTEFSRCPICLDLPVAAKMTRCGHVYCWHCILNYLALSDEPTRTCPICFDSIRKQDLKSAIATPFSNINVGDTIRMRLMRRERGSLIVVPVEEINLRSTNNMLEVSESNLNTSYSKLLLANDADILAIIEREKKDLLRELATDENCPKTCFIGEALQLLAVRENDILNKLDVKQSKKGPEKFIGDDKEVITEKSVNAVTVDGDQSVGAVTKYHYFYQASNGQYIFMHNINIRMLEHMYGNLENSPPIIEGKIIEKESDSITEELRKRMRYLQHLPITCQIEIAELEFKPPLITTETFNNFKDQIDFRRKRRQKRARDERLHEKRVLEKENRLMGKYPTPNIHIESLNQFPNFGAWPNNGVDNFSPSSFERDFLPLSPNSSPIFDEAFEQLSLGGSSFSDNNVSVTNLPTPPTNTVSKPSGPSFATMLTKSKTTDFWPGLENKSHQEKPKLTLVTGNHSHTGFVIKSRNLSESEGEQMEEFVPAPTYKQSFSQDIAWALAQSESSGSKSDKSNKKKKKNSHKLLFSTGMACANGGK